MDDSKAVKIQAAWRGKRERKSLKKQTISVIEIQRIVRGFFAKRAFQTDVESYREQKKLRKDQKQRLAAIRNREHDLRMLAQISPEQYFAYDKLRQGRAAKSIQRSWRNNRVLNLRPKKSSLEDNYQSSAKYHMFGYKTAKVDRVREKELRKSRELYASLSKNDPLLEKVDKFYKEIVSAYESKVDLSFSPREDDRLDIPADDLALGLDHLFQSIRTHALQRQMEEGKSQVNSFGNYRELLKQRQRMELLLSDYYAGKVESEYNKIDRVKSLLHSQRLMNDMQSLPTLDDMEAMMKQDAGVAVSEEEKRKSSKARNWLDGHPNDFTSYLTQNQDKAVADPDYKDQADIVKKSIYGHLQMSQQLTEARWKTFLLPIHVQEVAKTAAEGTNRDSLYVEETLDKPRFVLTALPTKFDSSGTSAEDSLKWVSYCLNGITNDIVPKELRTLRNRVLHSALHPTAYRDYANIALHKENMEVRRKSKIIEERVLLELKARAMHKLGKAFAISSLQQQEHSAIVIQSAMRAYMTRRRVRELVARRRIDKALHLLLHEVAQIDGGKDQRFSRLSSLLHQPESMLNTFLPLPPAVSTAGKLHRQKLDLTSTTKKDPVQSSLEKYTLRSMLSPLVPPSNNQFTPYSQSYASDKDPKVMGSNVSGRPAFIKTVPQLSSLPSSSSRPHYANTNDSDNSQLHPIRSIWDDKRQYESDAKEQKLADETPQHKRGLNFQPNKQTSLGTFSTSAPITAHKPEPPSGIAPNTSTRSIKSVQFASQPPAQQQTYSSPMSARGISTSIRTPLSARETPRSEFARANAVSSVNVPHSAVSSVGDALSPFMGMNDLHADDGDGYGYISTPSLSRSLTESFGKVDTSGDK